MLWNKVHVFIIWEAFTHLWWRLISIVLGQELSTGAVQVFQKLSTYKVLLKLPVYMSFQLQSLFFFSSVVSLFLFVNLVLETEEHVTLFGDISRYISSYNPKHRHYISCLRSLFNSLNAKVVIIQKPVN